MKMKKIILPIFLALIISLSSFALFACSKKTTSTETFEILKTTMTTMGSDTSLFATTTADSGWTNTNFKGYATKFKLVDVSWNREGVRYKKDENGNLVKDNDGKYVTEKYIINNEYDPYAVLVAAGLEYINKYYTKLENLDLRADFGSLKDSATRLKNSYEYVKEEHNKYTGASTLLNQANVVNAQLLNGFFYNYRRAISDFSDKVYSCAFKLGDFLYSKVGLGGSFGGETLKQEDIEYYLDYKYLNILDDYRQIYMNSLKGVRLESYKLYSNYVDYSFSNFLLGVYVKEKATALTTAQAKALVNMFELLGNTRADALDAVNNFSLYDYATVYGNKIDAYKKDKEKAPIYYSKINDYYFSGGALYRMTTYLKNTFIA